MFCQVLCFKTIPVLVESRSQDTAANAGVLSVYLATILYYYLQLFIDIERDNIQSCWCLPKGFKRWGQNVLEFR